MALINFNELTKFDLRLVNLYYHNTTLYGSFEPMTRDRDDVVRETEFTIFNCVSGLEGRVWFAWLAEGTRSEGGTKHQ